MNKDEFELFKKHYAKATRPALLRLAYDWKCQSELIADAMKQSQQADCTLLAVNDLCCDVINSLGGMDKLTPEALQSYTEKRVQEFSEGLSIAAAGILKHGQLFLNDARSTSAKTGGVESGRIKKAGVEAQHNEIKNQATRLASNGTCKKDIPGIIAKNRNLTVRQVRNILKE